MLAAAASAFLCNPLQAEDQFRWTREATRDACGRISEGGSGAWEEETGMVLVWSGARDLMCSPSRMDTQPCGCTFV